MDRRDYKSLRQDRNRNTRENQNPSFSSTLLDAIYRSIDENNGEEREEELIFYRETMRKKQSHSSSNNNNVNCSLKENQQDLANLKRACLIEKWMEKKKISEKLVVRRKSMADFDRYSRNGMLLNSSSSSSDSSNFSGGLSSSDAEFIYGGGVNSNCRPKPIRTSVSTRQQQQPQQQKKSENARNYNNYHTDDHQIQWRKSEHESNFVKTKSRALKIYSDLKKIKQPISPGGRLTSFLNSLFTPGNSKKSKSSAPASTTTTCSSASSFSRSCLSKTPSSIGKLSSNGRPKRSVSFYPVSVIVDEDCRPCGQKSLQQEDHDQFGLIAVKNVRKSVSGRNRRVEENVRDHVMLKMYQRNGDLDMKAVNEASDDEDDDDAASCSSSDLFELDNLGSIGIDRYREELPVYETTHFDTNRAIAKGLFV